MFEFNDFFVYLNMISLYEEQSMKINQLFRSKIDMEVVIKLLNCFGLSNAMDKRFFCKNDLLHLNTVNKVKDMIDDLNNVYLPCKARIYLTHLNEKKCVTILKQVLRTQNFSLVSKEKHIDKQKTIFYQVCDTDNNRKKILNITHHPEVLSFV